MTVCRREVARDARLVGLPKGLPPHHYYLTTPVLLAAGGTAYTDGVLLSQEANGAAEMQQAQKRAAETTQCGCAGRAGI